MSDLLKHKNLQSTIKELNAKFGMKLKFITTREHAIAQIVEAIGNFTEEQQKMLSPEAVDIYNALLVGAVATEDAEVVVPSPSGDEDMCQAYGVLYEGADPECQACDQAEDCQEKTLLSKSTKKDKPVKEPKEKKEKKVKEPKVKSDGPVSRYGGWGVNTAAAMIENMLWDGTTLDEMVSAIVEKYNKDADKTLVKVQKHIVWLKNTKKVPITLEGGIYKAEVEFI